MGTGVRLEFPAEGAVRPGDLVTPTATGGCVPHATADTKPLMLIAIEAEVFGRGLNTGSGYSSINATPDYVIGDRVYCEALHTGMQVNCNVPAGAPAIAVGAPLTSNGSGGVKIGTAANAIGYAAEAVDNSAGTTLTRIRVMLL
jgi:hypothetical protein